MSAETTKEIQLEIGHVLFVDIVGYSKLLITEQSEQLQTLKEIVRATEQFRRAEAADKLLRLPTGDGGPLVFRTSPDAPVLCALEISKELKKHPEPQVAMLTVRTHYVPDYNAITAWATLAAVLAALFLALLWEPIRRRWNAPKLELQLRDRDIDESLGTSVTGGVVVTRNV